MGRQPEAPGALPLGVGAPDVEARPATGSQTGRYRRGVGFAAANWMYFVDPTARSSSRVEGGVLVASTAVQDMGTGSRTVLGACRRRRLRGRPDRGGRPSRARAQRRDPRTGLGWQPHDRLALVDGRRGGHQPARRIGTDLADAPDGTSATAKRGGDRGLRRRARDDERHPGRPRVLGGRPRQRGRGRHAHRPDPRRCACTGASPSAASTPRVCARSQCEGSVIQGVGLALYENQVLDPHTGLTLTANLEDYRIPQLGDTPEIDIHFHEEGWDRVPGGGVGLGEVATISPAASVGNAIFNATGWRPTDAAGAAGPAARGPAGRGAR